MPKTKIIFAISALILASLACNTLLPAAEPTPIQAPALPATEAEVPRVSLEEALAAYTAGTATIVDVRGPDAYNASHIAGAINIPLGTIETDPTNLNLDKDQWIITYCT